MGSEKRERHRTQRNARIEQAMATQAQAERRRRVTIVVAIVAVALVAVAVVVALGGDDDPELIAQGDVTTCVERVDDLPDGAPEFDVPVGPAPTELVIEDLVVGDGAEVAPGDSVRAHYIGVACSTGTIFDSSYERGEPITFSLTQVIPGWTEGLVGMRVGGQRLLVIPSELAYGAAGSPPAIGPNEPLTFLVELVDVTPVGDEPAPEPAPEPTATGTTECPPAEGADRQLAFDGPPPMCLEPGASYVAVFDTSVGEVTVELDAEQMPGTTNNFVVLARYGYYDETLLFRTDPSIGIIQGGAPNTNSPADPGPGYTIPDEGGTFDFSTGGGTGPFSYGPGQLVMARSAGPASSGAQFFFTVNDSASFLDAQGTYLLFGQVVEGLDVLTEILASHVDDPSSGLGGGPAEEVVVREVRIEQS